jgi:CRISPR/Cas system CSM-associated protein Csm3 (group 7 of RAMP superfamily)
MFRRFRIAGTLRTQSPLRIGCGVDIRFSETGRPRAGGTDPLVAIVARDALGRARLEESALRSALKRALPSTVGDSIGISLFGSRATPGANHTSVENGRLSVKCGSAVRHDSPPAEASREPFFDAASYTAVRVSPAINRVTGSADDGMLAWEEFVPAGAEFPFELTVDVIVPAGEESAKRAGWGEVAVLQLALEGELTLGAHTGDGWGRLVCEATPILYTFSSEDVNRVSVGKGADPASLYKRAGPAAERGIQGMMTQLRPKSKAERAVLSIDLELTLREHFGVGQVDDGENGAVVAGRKAPAITMRRRLRSQFERILRTRGVTIPHSDPTGCRRQSGGDTITGPHGLCLVCQTFGASGWASIVTCDELRPSTGGDVVEVKHFRTPLDAFTSGTVNHMLASRVVAHPSTTAGARYSGGVHVDLARLKLTMQQSQILGALLLLLRDVTEGDVPIGFSGAVGYGQFLGKASVSSASAHQDDVPLATLPRTLFEAGNGRLGTDVRGQQDPAIASLIAEFDTFCEQNAPRPALQNASVYVPPTPVAGPVSADVLNQPFQAPPPHSPPAGSIFASRAYVPVLNAPSLHDIHVDSRAHAPHLTHDRYVDGTYSGCITVALRTQSSVVIGQQSVTGDRNNQVPAAITPYQRGDGHGAPGSELRGMIESVAAAASNSAMRVFANTLLTSREQMTAEGNMRGVLPCIGRVERGRSPDSKLYVKPLARPPMKVVGARLENAASVAGRLPWPSDPLLCTRYYVLDAQTTNNQGVENLLTTAGSQIVHLIGSPAHPGDRKIKKNLLLGYTITGALEARLLAAAPGNKRVAIMGYLLHLRPESVLPPMKKHAIFVRADSEMKLIPISQGARDAFAVLSRERVAWPSGDDVKRPLTHFMSLTFDASDESTLEGQLVYFDVERHNGQTLVSRFALTSIWRRLLGDTAANREWELPTTHAFVAGLGDFGSEKLPMHAGRTTISIAEAMFGWITHTYTADAPAPRKTGEADGIDVAAPDAVPLPPTFASRLRFGSALKTLQDDDFAPEAFLPPTSASSPSCVDLAHIRPDGTRADRAHASPGVTQLHGRRFAVHSEQDSLLSHREVEDWFEGKVHLCRKVRPIKKDVNFSFEIRFDNLTPTELGLLLFSIEPSDSFCHKIGSGRFSGLGSVRLQVSALHFVNRMMRYSAAGAGTTREDEDTQLTLAASLRAEALAGMRNVAPAAVNAVLRIGQNWAKFTSPPIVKGQEPREHSVRHGYLHGTANRELPVNQREFLPTVAAMPLPLMKILRPPKSRLRYLFPAENAPGWGELPGGSKRYASAGNTFRVNGVGQTLNANPGEDYVYVLVGFAPDAILQAIKGCMHICIAANDLAAFVRAP